MDCNTRWRGGQPMSAVCDVGLTASGFWTRVRPLSGVMEDKMKAVSALILMVSVALSSVAFAQTTNATLGGTVSDSSGALIPGVTVTATNNATGIASTAITNESGVYQFASLQTGTYKVTAELPGFQTQLVNNFALGISQQARLNFTLQVGAVSQTVEVSVAAESELKTTSASVTTILPQTQLQDL